MTMQYTVLLKRDPTFLDENVNASENVFDFDIAGTVDAENLDDAYTKTQNLENLWNPGKPCRSVSVGDVLMERGGNAYRVQAFGFSKIQLRAYLEQQ